VPGQFSLSGSHTYSEDGDFTMTITVKDDGVLAATATGDVTVTENLITAAGQNISGIEGVTLSKTVATFSDTDLEPISDYAASIDWGDGNVTGGTIVALGGGNYAVKGSHAYSDEGAYGMTISINDDGTLAATAGAHANITDAPLSNAAGKTFSIMEGNTFNGNVASFSDANLLAGASDFTATINWGDGNTTSGSVVKDSAGKFHVNGSHAYAETGPYNTAIQIHDLGGQNATAHGIAHVPEAPLFAGSPLTLHLTHGAAFSGTVGNFIDGDPLNTATGDYKATINWGDGKTSKASFALTSAGHWKVLGGHTYAKKGTYHLSLTVIDTGGASAVVTATVIVS